MVELRERLRPLLPAKTGSGLFAATLWVNGLNAAFFWCARHGWLIPQLLDGSWIIPSFLFVDRFVPKVVVATPALGLAVSAGYAVVWLLHREEVFEAHGIALDGRADHRHRWLAGRVRLHRVGASA